MSSTSGGGISVITLQFSLDVSLGVAEQEVQAAISASGSLLPGDLPTPPVYRKVNPADVPILTLAVTSESLPLPKVYDLVDTRMTQRLSQLSGVGMVSLAGGQRPAVRVQVNPMALAARGCNWRTCRKPSARANSNQPKGNFDGPVRSVIMDANDQLQSAEEYRERIVAWRNGAPVRLGQVASVEDGAEDRYLAAWVDEQPAVLVNIQRQPGANVIAVADQVKALLPQLTRQPASRRAGARPDRPHRKHPRVRARRAVGTGVRRGAGRAGHLPVPAQPARHADPELCRAAVADRHLRLHAPGGLLHQQPHADGADHRRRLRGGRRHRHAGEHRALPRAGPQPLSAALKGAGQIGFTLLSLTFSLIAVLIPLLFMEDVVGRLFREFAVSLAVAILISLVVSLTLTPMMCARLLPAHAEGAPGLLDRVQARSYMTAGLHTLRRSG